MPTFGQFLGHLSSAFFGSAAVLQQAKHLVQLADCLLEYFYGIDDQFLRLWEIVGVFERVLLKSLEPVQLELPLLDIADVKAVPAVVVRVGGLSFCLPVGILAVAAFELGEVL